MFFLAVEFLNTKFGRYLNPDIEENGREDLTELVEGCTSCHPIL